MLFTSDNTVRNRMLFHFLKISEFGHPTFWKDSDNMSYVCSLIRLLFWFNKTTILNFSKCIFLSSILLCSTQTYNNSYKNCCFFLVLKTCLIEFILKYKHFIKCRALVNVGAEQERVKLDRCELQQDHRCRVHLMRWRKLCGLKISHLLLLHTDWSFSGHYASAACIPPSRIP